MGSRRARQFHSLRSIPAGAALVVLAFALMAPVAIAGMNKTSIGFAGLTVAWNVMGAGVGEEVFCRGFVQSHLNRVCGGPWRIWEIDFGPGLIASALLFGLVHALNTVDYFHGRWTFAWAYAAQNIFIGLGYGALREKTGSILSGVIVHALADVWLRVPGLAGWE
jgi:membrane protease YdiL (CAAX protease family)